jgi:hypothetical protein
VTLYRRVGGLVVALAFATVLTVAAAAPALAHGSGPPIPDAAYYRTAITADGALPSGVTTSVDPGGEWLQVSYTGPAEVIVLGYSREPYLRVNAAGAQENALSPTTYLNKAGFAELPAGTQTADVAPAWQPIATTGRVRWHDHRIHWMGQTQPPSVAADPTHPHLVSEWTVHATAAGLPFDIRGTLSWIGKPGSSHLSGFTWLILAGGNLPFVAVLVVLTLRQRRRKAAGAPSAPTPVPPPPAPTPAPMVSADRPHS